MNIQEESDQLIQQIQNLELQLSSLKKQIGKSRIHISQRMSSNFFNIKLKASHNIMSISPATQIQQVKLFTNFLMSLHQKKPGNIQTQNTFITYTGDGQYNQFVINHPIPFTKSFVFRFKICKSESKRIIIGVIDYNRIIKILNSQSNPYSHHSGLVVALELSSMKIYAPSPNQPSVSSEFDFTHGNKFYQGNQREGQIIEVEVNREQGQIIWSKKQNKIKFNHNLLMEKQTILLPYVELCQTNNTVEYIFDSKTKKI